MSWSISLIGTPPKLKEALQARSAKETGQCKVEYDAALPHLVGLEQNFDQEGSPQPLVAIEAQGSGYCQSGGGGMPEKQLRRNCTVKITPFYGTFVGAVLLLALLLVAAHSAVACDCGALCECGPVCRCGEPVAVTELDESTKTDISPQIVYSTFEGDGVQFVSAPCAGGRCQLAAAVGERLTHRRDGTPRQPGRRLLGGARRLVAGAAERIQNRPRLFRRRY